MPRPPSFDEAGVEDKPEWVRGLPQLGPGEIEDVGDTYRNRLEMLLSLDEMVAGLIEELRIAGELENTYVFFTSDNGYHLGEHRLKLGKRTVYEEAARVPLAVRDPGVHAGQTVDELTPNTDFAPTIAELAGASAPDFVDGRSLASFWAAPQPRPGARLPYSNTGAGGEPATSRPRPTPPSEPKPTGTSSTTRGRRILRPFLRPARVGELSHECEPRARREPEIPPRRPENLRRRILPGSRRRPVAPGQSSAPERDL